MSNKKKQNYCIDCGSPIAQRSTRCRCCATKECWRRGTYSHEEWRHKKSAAMQAMWKCGVLGNEEHRRKLSDIAKKRWECGSLGGDELRRKLSEGMKVAWARGDFDGVHNEEWSRKQSEVTKAAWAKGVYDGVFQSPTSIERQVAAALDIMSIEHVPQYRVDGSGWVFDEFVPPATLIEVQGDYWHSLPSNQQRDVEKAQWAQDNGFELIEIWEHEINAHGAWSIIANLPL